MIVRSLLTLLGFQTDTKTLNGYNQALQKTIQFTKVLAVATAGLGFALLKTAGDMEQVEIAFETMLGSGEKAQKLIEEITDFAATTPFELKGLLKSSKLLLAYGIEAEKILPTLETLGNISAGVGVDVNRLALVFGQVKTQTKLMGQDLRQFTSAGVPLISALAKHFGIAEGEVMKLVSAGKVGFKDVEAALQSLTAEGGQFFNLMDKQSKSFLGIISNIQDILGIFAVEIGKDLLPMAKELSLTFLDFLETNKELIKTNIVGFFKGVVRSIAFVFLFLRKLFGLLKPFIKRLNEMTGGGFDLIKIFKGIVKIIGPVVKAIGDLLSVIFDLTANIIDMFNNMDGGNIIMENIATSFANLGSKIKFIVDIIKFLKPVLDLIIAPLIWILLLFTKIDTAIKEFEKLIIDNIIPTAKMLIEAVKNFFLGLPAFFVKLWEDISTAFINGVDNVLEFFGKIRDEALKIVGIIAGFFVGVFNSVKDVIMDVVDFIGGVIDGMIQGITGFISKVGELFTDPVKFFGDLASGALDLGKAIGDFFVKPLDPETGSEKFIPTTFAPFGPLSGGSTTKTDINVSPTINLTVPPGTDEMQKANLEKQANILFSQGFDSVLREAITNSPGVD